MSRRAQPKRPPKVRQAEWRDDAPPHDTQTEAVVVGALLSEGTPSTLLPYLLPDMFYDAAHRQIFEAIAAVALRGEGAPDVLAVARELAERDQLDGLGGSGTLRALVEGWDKQPLHPMATARYLDDYRLQRLAVQLKLAPLAGTGEESVRQMMQQLRDAVRIIKPLARTAAEIAVDVLRQYDAGADADVMPTGLHAWDAMVGGIQRGHFYVVGALTGGGKTVVGATLVRGLAENGFQGLIHSLEMEDTRIFKRELAAVAGIENWRVQRGRFTADEIDGLAAAVRHVSKLPWLVRDDDGTWPQHLAAYESLCLQYPGIRVLVVDYIGLIQQHEVRDDTRAQFLDQVSRSLKGLARRQHIAVVALCQLNREAEKSSRPVLKDLRESGGIAQNADAVILFDVKAMRSKKVPYNPDEVQILDAYVEKNRDGPTGHFQLSFSPRFQRIWDAQAPQAQAASPWEGDDVPLPPEDEAPLLRGVS